jgi:hypothetical protein
VTTPTKRGRVTPVDTDDNTAAQIALVDAALHLRRIQRAASPLTDRVVDSLGAQPAGWGYYLTPAEAIEVFNVLKQVRRNG